MLTDEQRDRIAAAGQRLGLSFSAEQFKQIDTTCQLLMEWNGKMNLTAIRDLDGIVDKHFIDSFYGHPHMGEKDLILDIGTGAGFPGLALKIAAPSRRVIMIDGTGKKIGFVQTVLRELGFPPESAIQQRAEDKGFQFGLAAQFDVVTARAVAKIDKLAELAAPFLKLRTGKLVLYKGPAEATDAAQIAPERFSKPEIVNYRLPEGDERAILIYTRQPK